MWGYRCEDNRCQKYQLTADNNNTAKGLSLCRLYCDEKNAGTLWPIPSGLIEVSNDIFQLNLNEVTFDTENFKKVPEYWEMAQRRFQDMQQKKTPQKYSLKNGGNALVIEVVAASDDMCKQDVLNSVRM